MFFSRCSNANTAKLSQRFSEHEYFILKFLLKNQFYMLTQYNLKFVQFFDAKKNMIRKVFEKQNNYQYHYNIKKVFIILDV